MTLPLENYVDHADECAQRVLNAWGPVVSSGNKDALTAEFSSLMDILCRYWSARRTANEHRLDGTLTKEEAAEEESTRLEFAKAYKAWFEASATE